MREKDIENQILEYLAYTPGFYWKNQSTGLYDPSKKVFRKSKNKFLINGTSDILGILPNGRFVAIEVKTPKGKVTQAQELFIDTINKNGGIAFVARSVKDVEQKLKDSVYFFN